MDLYRVYIMMNPYTYSFLSYDKGTDLPFEQILMRYGAWRPGKGAGEPEEEGGLFDVISAATRASRTSVGQWRSSIEPWSDLVESIRRTWGDGPRVYSLAAIAAGIRSKEARAAGFGDLLNHSLPLVERARYARLKSALTWWRKTLTAVPVPGDTILVLILLTSWAPSTVIKGLGARAGKIIDALSARDWRDLILSVQAVIAATNEGRSSLSGFDDVGIATIESARLRALLMLRLPRGLSHKVWLNLIEAMDGSDHELEAFLAVRGVAEAHREPKAWKSLIAFHRNSDAKVAGSEADYSESYDRYYISHRTSMPVSIAQDVADNLNNLPIYIVEVAESTLSKRTGPASSPLGAVSAEQGWFA